MKEDAEKRRLVILHGYQMQNKWMTWGLDKMLDQDLTWNSLIYRYSEELTKFVLNGSLNTLPTPDNLRRWKQAKGIQCGLCGHPDCTLKHILAGCKWVFNVESKLPREDRFTWRHNCLLLELALAIMSKLQEINAKPVVSTKPTNTQAFVKAGTCKQNRKHKSLPSILEQARDWRCNFDLPECRTDRSQLTFPHDICETSKRIDGYIVSREKKICVRGPEMTAPMDDNVDKWHKIKTNKYNDAITQEGWTFENLIVEVGALGWIPPSTHAQLKHLGFSTSEISKLKENLRYVARKCSYIIYVNRFNKDFHPWRIKASCEAFDTAHLPSSPLLDKGPPEVTARSEALHFLQKNVSHPNSAMEDCNIRANAVSEPVDKGPAKSTELPLSDVDNIDEELLIEEELQRESVANSLPTYNDF